MSNWQNCPTLTGSLITLKPLSMDYLNDLQEAVRDGELWKLWYTIVPSPEEMKDDIENKLLLLNKGRMLPFVVIENISEKAIGITTYGNLDASNRRLDIGFTWYRKKAQKTLINTECKLLLLKYAFENLNCLAVDFRVTSLNFNSRRAVERLGAKLDGIIRNYSILPNGIILDMAFYSIIDTEWPMVKINLKYKLSSK